MLDRNSKVAIVVAERKEVDFLMIALDAHKMKNVVAFTDPYEAYEVAVRQLFDVFITRFEMPKLNGLSFIQKIRATGNYGAEPHLILCDNVDGKILAVLQEFDLNYIMSKPFSKQKVIEKLEFMIYQENNISPEDQMYRSARGALQNKVMDMAASMSEELLKNSPKIEKFQMLAGDIAFDKNDFKSAEASYRAALEINPKSAAGSHKLAAVLMKTGDFKTASDMLAKLADTNPYNIRLLENAGLSSLQAHEYERAEKYTSQLRQIDEKNNVAGEVQANVCLAKGEYDDVLDALAKSHDEKQIVQFLNNAGVKLSQGNDVTGALRMYQSAAEKLGKNKFLYAIYFNMGLAFVKGGDPAKAADAFQKSLKLKPDFDKAARQLQQLASSPKKTAA